jgi:hypothetical protein
VGLRTAAGARSFALGLPLSVASMNIGSFATLAAPRLVSREPVHDGPPAVVVLEIDIGDDEISYGCHWNECGSVVYGFLLGATNGLVSGPPRAFFSKHASSRSNANALLSNGTRIVAPSPRT